MDWEAFGTAFLNKTSEYMDEDRNRYNSTLEDFRANRDKNLAAFEDKKTRAGLNFGQAKLAMENGATNDMVQQAMDSGPTGLTDLNTRLTDYKTKMGKYWDKTSVEATFDGMLPADFISRQLDAGGIESELQKMYGIVEPSVGSREDNRTWLQKAMMIDPIGSAKAELDATPMSEGYSALDISKIAQSATWKSLNPGASVNYPAMMIWTAEDALTLESAKDTYLRNKDNKMYTVAQYTDAKDAVKTFFKNRDDPLEKSRRTEENPLGKSVNRLEYEKNMGILTHMRDVELSPFYTQYWQTYGQSFLNRHSGEAAVFGGDDAMEYIVFSGTDLEGFGAKLGDDNTYTLDGDNFTQMPNGIGYRKSMAGKPDNSTELQTILLEEAKAELLAEDFAIYNVDPIVLANSDHPNIKPLQDMLATLEEEGSVTYVQSNDEGVIVAGQIVKSDGSKKELPPLILDTLNELNNNSTVSIDKPIPDVDTPFVLPEGETITLPTDFTPISLKLGNSNAKDFRVVKIEASSRGNYLVYVEEKYTRSVTKIQINPEKKLYGNAKKLADAGFNVLDVIQQYKP